MFQRCGCYNTDFETIAWVQNHGDTNPSEQANCYRRSTFQAILQSTTRSRDSAWDFSSRNEKNIVEKSRIQMIILNYCKIGLKKLRDLALLLVMLNDKLQSMNVYTLFIKLTNKINEMRNADLIYVYLDKYLHNSATISDK